MTTTIWWLRRDLRLHDSSALDSALRRGGTVIPVFIIDPALWQGNWFSPRRAEFLVANLRSLEADLRQRGSYLVIRNGPPQQELQNLLAETGADSIVAEKEYSPYAKRRDQAVGAALPLELVQGSTIHPPENLLKNDGTPYRIYTPFMRKWKQLPFPTPSDLIPAPARIPTPASINSDPLPDTTGSGQSLFPAGEAEAQQRLSAFTEQPSALAHRYQSLRDRPDVEGTSQLSPYLRLGVLSLRQAVVAAQTAVLNAQSQPQRQSAETWLNQLIWREFFTTIMVHYPQARRQSFRPEYRQLAWHNDPQDFEDWKIGATGYPLVDAGMRQLAATGWMHNRVRMVAASFLVKNLLIDWRWGEAWFMQNLLDGDPAVNNGSWQWVAGTGTDAAPYFRIFNPITQSQKFDPHGDYIRRWVPELENVPGKFIHTPWKMDPAIQKTSGTTIGADYPEPIIDLAFSRQRVLAAYSKR